MQNPVTEAREALSLTLREFSERVGVTQRFLENVEAGLVVAIPRSIRDGLFHLQDDAGLDHSFNLDADYRKWISWERVGVVGEPWPQPRQAVAASREGHHQISPFYLFRIDMMDMDNRHAFCTLFKLPPATVMRYEQGVTQAMPRAIEEALIDVDYPYMTELADLQSQWYREVVA
jgi:transcriptional regulator with XRE-family HTH domain